MFKLTNSIYRVLNQGENSLSYKGVTYKIDDSERKTLRKLQLVYGVIPGIGLILYFCLDRLFSFDLWLSFMTYFIFTIMAIVCYNILIVKLVLSKFAIVKENVK